MKMKNVLIGLAAVSLLLLAACGQTSKAASTKGVIKIGILQQINQTALDDTRKGFIAELAKHGYKGNKIKIDYVNANGDQANLSTMATRLKNDHNDVNLAIATAAAQAVAKADTSTPLVFTAVTDPVSAGLVKNMQKPGGNVTGVVDLVNIQKQINYMHRVFPKAKTIGMIYNASEANSVVQIKDAKAACKKLGLKVVTQTVSSTNDVEQATLSVAQKADAIYLPTDNTMAAAMSTVGKISLKEKVPVVAGASTMVQEGGVVTQGISYKELGRQTARLAIKLIKGKKAASLPVESPAKVMVIKNEKMMKAFGLTDADVE